MPPTAARYSLPYSSSNPTSSTVMPLATSMRQDLIWCGANAAGKLAQIRQRDHRGHRAALRLVAAHHQSLAILGTLQPVPTGRSGMRVGFGILLVHRLIYPIATWVHAYIRCILETPPGGGVGPSGAGAWLHPRITGMTHTITIRTSIPESRTIEVALPSNTPTGDAEIVITVVPDAPRRRCTGRDMLNSEVFGMWADRTDIVDSAEYARELRTRAWTRPAQ